jgi:hypothetical protein
MVGRRLLALCLALHAASCNIPEAPHSTGGVRLPDAGRLEDAGTDAPHDGFAPPLVCPRAFAVASSDYQSTNVSIVSPNGTVLSESIVSSGSAPPGLTTALSGDVVFPSSATPSGRLVLVDRLVNSALTWFDVETASVIRQLSVATGFASNPYDYIEVTESKAYVTRYETNPIPGRQPFDEGGDALIVDTKAFSITGRISLATAEDGAYLPRPNRLIQVGSEVWVMLERWDADFKTVASSRIAGIDSSSDAISWSLDLPGADNCGGLARSPSGKRVAVSCSGKLATPDDAGRALILIDATTSPPAELRRYPEADVLDSPFAPYLAFASEELLVGVAYGQDGGPRNDSLFTVNVDTGEVKVVLDAGAGFALGDVLCSPGCTDSCLLADANSKTVRVLRTENGRLTEERAVAVDPSIGLPPRYLGAL